MTTSSHLDDGIRMANDTEFGLAVYGFSEDIHRAQYLAESLHAGMADINRRAISEPSAPFGESNNPASVAKAEPRAPTNIST